MNRSLKYKTPKDHTDWLRLRKDGIGGSDAAAVAGLSEWESAYSIWADKTGRTNDPENPEEPNEAMRQGTDLEDYVAKRFCQATGKKVRRNNRMIFNDSYPFAYADVDRWVVGENAGLECKTTSSLSLKKFKNGEYPINYYVQCMHYMAVTGADKYYLAVLILGKDFKIFEIERDQEFIDYLMRIEAAFWDCVTYDTPPYVDGSDSTSKAINAIYSDSSDTTVDLFGKGSMIRQLQSMKQQAKELNAEIKKKEQALKASLGEAQTGEVDEFVVTWKPQTRSSFQVKEFEKDHPEIDLSPYYKTTTSRVLRIKELT